MKGDLFNKAHGPYEHKDLCLQNGIYSERLNMISEGVEELKIDGWVETVKLQKLEAAERAAHNARAREIEKVPQLMQRV